MNELKRVIILDSKPLGEICNPIRYGETKPLIEFFREHQITLRVAEITDYELRRELRLQQLDKGINNLNRFEHRGQIIPLTRESLIMAAELWGELGNPEAKTPNQTNINFDAIMVAQALQLRNSFDQIIILTIKVQKLIKFEKFGINFWEWQQALVDCHQGQINLSSLTSFE